MSELVGVTLVNEFGRLGNRNCCLTLLQEHRVLTLPPDNSPINNRVSESQSGDRNRQC